ncbi:MAG: hypothetical protein AD742_17590 [Methylibium sp. NZG]|nr:MAG: hypothetical protein AD742_17590 [Methylibium sp. NZG]
MPDRPLDRTTERDTRWNASALREQLDPLLPGLSVEVLARTASTNSVLLERLRAGLAAARDEADIAADGRADSAPDAAPALVRRSVESAAFARRSTLAAPCLLVTEQQTAGRGRHGRTWHSAIDGAAGASLTFSLSLSLRRDDWSGLSLAVGVALADALDPRQAPGQANIGLKWPNDLWLMDGTGLGRKLGGILIETVAAGAHRQAVIGIGLNVQPIVQSVGADAASTGFASLHELDATASATGVLHRVALPLALALRQFERSGFSAFCDRFAARDLLRGRSVHTTQPDVPRGVAQGVSDQGALLVQTDAGLLPVTSGEVSVRLNPVAGAQVSPAFDASVAGAAC